MNEFKLKESLYEAIQNWLLNASELHEWDGLDVIVGEKTVEYMTELAFSMLKVCAESQQTALKEGYFKKLE